MCFYHYHRSTTYKNFGIRLAFVATRSGLLRYSDHSEAFADVDEQRQEESGRGPPDDDEIKEP